MTYQKETTYIFSDTLFNNVVDAHRACAEKWLSADGLNSESEQVEALQEYTDNELAVECANGWNMQALDWFSLEDLEEAFHDIRIEMGLQ